jgi:hypothetical protein
MSNNSVGEYFSSAVAMCTKAHETYEAKRLECVAYVNEHFFTSPVAKRIFERVSRSVTEVFVGLSAASGILVVPAMLVLAAKKLLPLGMYMIQSNKEDASAESLSTKWEEIKQQYKNDFKETTGSILFVVLAVNAVFSLTIGFLTMNPGLMLWGGCYLGAASYVIYNSIKSEAAVPIPPPPSAT